MRTPDNKKLHVIACITDSYFYIYQTLFNKTLPQEFDSITLFHVRDNQTLPGQVGTDNFKKINYEKLHFIRRQMTASSGDNLLVLDLDIVFFRPFKQIINEALNEYDMAFQYDTSDNHVANVGVWAMQCSQKNIDFFDKEILPRAEALLLTREEFNEKHANDRGDWTMDSGWRTQWSPRLAGALYEQWGKNNHNKKREAIAFDGDQCVVNAAILTPRYGHNIDICLLPNSFSQGHLDGGKNPKKCVLYHAVGSSGVKEKIKHMQEKFFEISNKIVNNEN
tara:strand:+ start:1205 stop:2041 length:837 start_codon:yes stop_codon:yes gene_type:complete